MRSILMTALLASGCAEAEKLAGPVADQSFQVETLNGARLPAQIATYSGPEGVLCVEELVAGNLSFYGERRFGFSLSIRIRCGTTSRGGSDESVGTYTQNGDEIRFHTERKGLTSFTSGRVAGARIEMTGTRTSGTRLDLVLTRR